MAEEWKHGLCSCNSGTCCCVICCAPCEVYKTAERIGESGILYGLLTCFLPCIGGMLLRRKIRKKYNIEGSDLEDAGISCLCTPCVGSGENGLLFLCFYVYFSEVRQNLLNFAGGAPSSTAHFSSKVE